jgi:hypothetical protein
MVTFTHLSAVYASPSSVPASLGSRQHVLGSKSRIVTALWQQGSVSPSGQRRPNAGSFYKFAQSCSCLQRLQRLIALDSLSVPWASAMQHDAANQDKITQKNHRTKLLFVHKTPHSLSLSNSRADSSSRRQINKHVQQTRNLGREQQERLERLEAPRIDLFFNSSVQPQTDLQLTQIPPGTIPLCNTSSIEDLSNTLARPNEACELCTRQYANTRENTNS